jgi:fumarate reductase flavoprotein subunit
MADIRTGALRFVEAKAVLMATGGGPTMYRYHTPSGDKSMDGIAMALRAGLPLRDMEMVQFHPTGLLAGPDTRMTGTVLEEGLRGAGGYLLNGAMHRFMGDYDPKLERATRDVVSRGIYAEMKAGRTTPNGGVYITMAHLGPKDVAKKFKGMVDRCRDCGFDLAGGLVEVVPTAHYFMGGLVCRPDTSTEMPGLYVAGEDASGMHGRTASVATGSRTRPCSAASRATPSRAGSAPIRAGLSPTPISLPSKSSARSILSPGSPAT